MLRLALLGSRSARGRLAGIVLGIAVGTAMFVVLLGAYHGLNRREERSGWLSVDYVEPAGTLAPDEALLSSTYDVVGDERFRRLDIAVAPNSTVRLPAIETIPGPGEYIASPALQRLIARLPSDQLGDRFGVQIGAIPREALESPDALVVLQGGTEAELRRLPSTGVVSDFTPTYRSVFLGYRIVVVIGAIGMFFPVLLFINVVTQLGAVQRQERFAALRLIGASSRTVGAFAALETALTSLVGAMLGVCGALAIRPLVARFPVDGASFYPSDFAVGPLTIVLAIAAMVAVATVASYVKIVRTGVSPTNSSRDIRERTPSALRIVPLLLGIGSIAGATLGVRQRVAGGELLWVFVAGFVVTLFGIVAVGPWLTALLGRALARGSRSAAALIAARRIGATPSATFRSVSGLVVAVFVVTVFAGSAGAIADVTPVSDAPGRLPVDAVMLEPDDGVLPNVVSALPGITGVREVVVGYRLTEGVEIIVRQAEAAAFGFADVPDAPYLAFSIDSYLLGDGDAGASLAATPVPEPTRLVPTAVVVRTDGSAAAIDRVRTAVERTRFTGAVFTQRQLIDEASEQQVQELKVLAYVGAIVSILIAGCSLAIATACAMLDRKRVLGLMRLMGMPEGNLRRIVAIEAGVPLAAVLGLVIALGFGVAWCIIDGTSTHSVGYPDRWYALSIGAGLLLALAMIAATFGLIRRNTLVTVTRFE